jgi:LPXTG-site transpeptidase (sortase) family protein
MLPVDPAALAIIAATVWFVVYLGYILVAGMGTFWVVVWPEGHALRRLRAVAGVGIALIGLGTVVETLVDLHPGEYPGGETAAGQSGTWLLVRLAALAVAGFFGAELLRHPVRGWRRVCILALIVVLTFTLVVESTVIASPRVVAIAATMGAYLLALAAWLGGLVALAALLIPRDRPGGLDRVWTRFSWFTGMSVLVMAITGTAQHLVARGTATSRSGVLLLIEVPVLLATVLLSRYAVAYGKRMAFRERYLRGLAVESSGQLPRLRGAIGIQLILSVAMVAMAVAQLAVLPVPGRPGTPPLGDPVPTTPVATAGHARPASSDKPRFIPERIGLPDGASAAVVPVATEGRELVVPEDSDRVGWWDGSSYVGDPYGSTVIAGHVDTFDRGIGFFFRLWSIRVGERVVLSAGDQRQAYKITSLRQVPRTDLVDEKEVFNITGPPRLVLITCAGTFRADRGGYSRNLIVVAQPIS